MSRTDKTDPSWVKLRRYGVESHDHRRGECDFISDPRQIPLPRWRYQTCSYWYVDYYDGWFAQPRSLKDFTRFAHKRERQAVRRALESGNYDALPMRGTARNDAKWALS